MNRNYEFTMQLSAEKTSRIYQGEARYLLVYTDDGVKLQLPALNFRSYVTNEGIIGRFCVEINDENKIVDLYQKA